MLEKTIKIYVVEDDTTISSNIKNSLAKWGFEVSTANDFQNIINEFIVFQPDIVLMDISLPFYSGHYWTTEIRKISNNPIIFISSNGDDMNQVMSINLGADDFICKPFSTELLVAKINAVLRRLSPTKQADSNFVFKDFVLNTIDHTVENTLDNTKITITPTETKILSYLFKNANNIVSKKQLITQLWQSDEFIDDNTLQVNMTRLRKKLNQIQLASQIHTLRGVGYILGGD